MKRLLLIVLFLAFAGIAFAQENLSVVKLKSGIEIRGEIVELIDGVSVTIKNNDGLFSYNMYEVASINGKSSNTNKTNKNKSTSKTYSTSKSSDNKGKRLKSKDFSLYLWYAERDSNPRPTDS